MSREGLSRAQLEPQLDVLLDVRTLHCEEHVDKKVRYFEIECDQTIFFHESGGQPGDRGTLNDVQVLDVYRNAKGKIVHKTLEPIAAGTLVKQQVDWKRRLDHTQQHSGQHLISAIAHNIFGWNTVAWWLSSHPDASYIDFDTPAISDEQIAKLQQELTFAIMNGNQVRVHLFHSEIEYEAEAATRSALYGGKPLIKSEKNSKTEPAGSADPHITLRVVEIEGVDFNKCCGTHVKNISELMLVRIMKIERVKKHSRLHFLAGFRALNYFDESLALCKSLNELLNTSRDQFVSCVDRMQTQLRDNTKALEASNEELAAFLVKEKQKENSNLFFLYRPNASAGFLRMLLDTLDAVSIAPYKIGFVCSSDSFELRIGKSVSNSATVLSPEDFKTVTDLLGAKGGGKAGRYQGKAKLNAFDDESRSKVFAFLSVLVAK